MNYFPETLPLRLCLVTIAYKTRWFSLLLLPVSLALLLSLFLQAETVQVLEHDFFERCKFKVAIAALTITFSTSSWIIFSMILLKSARHPHFNQQHHAYGSFFQWPRGLEPVLLHDKLLYLSKLVDLRRNASTHTFDQQLLTSFLSSLQTELLKVEEESEKLMLKLHGTQEADLNLLQGNLVEARSSQRVLMQKLQTVVELNSSTSRELDQLSPTLASLSSKLRREELKHNRALETKGKTQQEIDRLTREINAQSAEAHRVLTESTNKHQEASRRRCEIQSRIEEMQRQNCTVVEELGISGNDLLAVQGKLQDLERKVATAAREKAERRNEVRKQCEIIEIMEEEVEEVRRGIEAAVEKYKELCFRESELLREGMALVRPNPRVQPGATCKMGECSLCMEKDIDCVLVSCGHMCCCSDCASSLSRNRTPACPICREGIERVQKCYAC